MQIIANDTVFPCHRQLISQCSGRLRRMLAGYQNEDHSVIVLKNFSANVIKSILNYIYIGHADVPPEDFEEFWQAAVFLEITTILKDYADVYTAAQGLLMLSETRNNDVSLEVSVKSSHPRLSGFKDSDGYASATFHLQLHHILSSRDGHDFDFKIKIMILKSKS